jgi:hypothetical protein
MGTGSRQERQTSAGAHDFSLEYRPPVLPRVIHQHLSDIEGTLAAFLPLCRASCSSRASSRAPLLDPAGCWHVPGWWRRQRPAGVIARTVPQRLGPAGRGPVLGWWRRQRPAGVIVRSVIVGARSSTQHTLPRVKC